MSVQTQIDRLAEAKAAIKTAIEGKGVTVPDNALLGAYAALIDGIEAGGGNFDFNEYCNFSRATSGSETVASADRIVVVYHGLQTVPKFFAIMADYDTTITTNYRGIGGFGIMLPSENAFYSCALRMDGATRSSTNSIFSTTGFDHVPNTAGYGVYATNYEMGFGVGTQSQYFTILAGTTFHWIAMV